MKKAGVTQRVKPALLCGLSLIATVPAGPRVAVLVATPVTEKATENHMRQRRCRKGNPDTTAPVTATIVMIVAGTPAPLVTPPISRMVCVSGTLLILVFPEPVVVPVLIDVPRVAVLLGAPVTTVVVSAGAYLPRSDL